MREQLNFVLGELQSASRYKWPALIAAWVICVVGWAVIMALPSVYESSARVFADTRTALSPVIQGLAIQQDVSAQLNLVQQSLLSEEQIDRVIDEAGFADAATHRDRAGTHRREAARRRSRSTCVRSGDRSQPGGSIYSISYRDPDRERSLKVVDLLLTAFVENTMGGKQAQFRAGAEVPRRATAGKRVAPARGRAAAGGVQEGERRQHARRGGRLLHPPAERDGCQQKARTALSIAPRAATN